MKIEALNNLLYFARVSSNLLNEVEISFTIFVQYLRFDEIDIHVKIVETDELTRTFVNILRASEIWTRSFCSGDFKNLLAIWKCVESQPSEPYVLDNSTISLVSRSVQLSEICNELCI